MSIKEAFFAVCSDAKPARASYVSLYVNSPYYGGPEEGGWWGEDCKLVAYQICADDEEADVVQAKVCELAESLTRDAAVRSPHHTNSGTPSNLQRRTVQSSTEPRACHR